MNQNFENTIVPVAENFPQKLENNDILSTEKSIEQKSSEYSQLQSEMVKLGIDKQAILSALQEFKSTDTIEEKAEKALGTFMLGFGDKVLEEGFDSTKAMYNIGKVIALSDLVSKDIRDEFVRLTMSEIEKEIKSQELASGINKVANFDQLDEVEDFNEIIDINAQFRKGYTGLIEQLNKKYTGFEITSAIGEMQQILDKSTDGNEFLTTIMSQENLGEGVLKDLINGFLDLNDAEIFFSNVKNKHELQQFLASEKTQSSEPTISIESKASGEKPSWML
jgi:hypothetical protein